MLPLRPPSPCSLLLTRYPFSAPSVPFLKPVCSLSRLETATLNPKFRVYVYDIYVIYILRLMLDVGMLAMKVVKGKALDGKELESVTNHTENQINHSSMSPSWDLETNQGSYWSIIEICSITT